MSLCNGRGRCGEPFLSMANATAFAAKVASVAASAVSQQQDEEYTIVYRSRSPPPPLDTVVDTWAPLYFFLGLCVAWGVVMLLVLGSFYVKTGSPSEAQPLQKQIAATFTRPTYKQGEPAWRNASPEMIQQYAMIDGWTRAAFVRKVYAILATQLLVTVGLVVGLIYAGFVHGDPHYPSAFGHWIVGPGYFLSLLATLASLCVLCGLMGCKNNYPMNFVGLALFTALISFTIGIFCVAYYGAGFGQELVLAFVITCATFLALTVFTVFSKIDFSFLGPLLCCGIFILIIWSFILSLAFAFGGYSASWHYVFVIFGIIIFVGFIVYDTYMIVTRLGVDDYIIAAIELYLDIINLFLYLLQFLSSMSSN